MSGAHAALLVLAPIPLFPYDRYLTATNSGVLIAGYRAGAWLRTKPALVALVAMLAGLFAGNLIPVDRSDRTGACCSSTSASPACCRGWSAKAGRVLCRAR